MAMASWGPHSILASARFRGCMLGSLILPNSLHGNAVTPMWRGCGVSPWGKGTKVKLNLMCQNSRVSPGNHGSTWTCASSNEGGSGLGKGYNLVGTTATKP